MAANTDRSPRRPGWRYGPELTVRARVLAPSPCSR